MTDNPNVAPQEKPFAPIPRARYEKRLAEEAARVEAAVQAREQRDAAVFRAIRK